MAGGLVSLQNYGTYKCVGNKYLIDGCLFSRAPLLPYDKKTMQTMQYFYNNYYGQQLQQLPPLPPTLLELDCSNNCLQKLPPLPPTLLVLNCSYNCLQKLPDLPEGLKYFLLSGNPLSHYPLLHTCTKIIGTPEIKEYVNRINSRRRIQIRTAILKSDIMRVYAERTMAPINLMPLLADPDMDVNDFMEYLVEKL